MTISSSSTFPTDDQIVRARAEFRARTETAATRAQELIWSAVDDNDVESAILFADEAMHDDGSKAQMLSWCLYDAMWGISGLFVGHVMAACWWRPKAGNIISGWGFDEDAVVEALQDYCHPRGLMGDDEDYELWCRLRRKRRPITIWRGCSGCDVDRAGLGLSWTTDRATAEWFATSRSTGGEVPILVEATVVPKKIIGAWRFESEILVLPGDALNVQAVPILGLPRPW